MTDIPILLVHWSLIIGALISLSDIVSINGLAMILEYI